MELRKVELRENVKTTAVVTAADGRRRELRSAKTKKSTAAAATAGFGAVNYPQRISNSRRRRISLQWRTFWRTGGIPVAASCHSLKLPPYTRASVWDYYPAPYTSGGVRVRVCVCVRISAAAVAWSKLL